jgi:hypothetical protein
VTSVAQEWSGHLGGLLDAAAVARHLDTTEGGAVELAGQGRLIRLHTSAGEVVFPGFSSAPACHRQPLWRRVAAAPVSPWTAASWCVAPDPNALDGTSPAEWVGDPDRLLQAADRAAARLQM